MSDSNGSPQGMIPNLCLLPAAFLIVLFSVLLSLLFSLLVSPPNSTFWQTFALTSPFILWVTILSAAILCLVREQLNLLTVPSLTVSVMLLVGLTTAISSLLTISFVYNLEFKFNNFAQWWFIGRNIIVAEIITLAWLRYLFLEQQMQDSIKAESEAQFKALQAKIQPHFFFNTLNTIASLIHIAPNRAEKTIEQLADIFRVSLNPKQQLITLAEEVNLSKSYLAIEQERLGNRLSVIWDVSIDLESVVIPPFTLQPIVENAIYHGIQQMTQGGTITITIKQTERQVLIQVTNPVSSQPRHPGNQMALDNIRQRLQIRYQHKATLSTHQGNESYTVTLELPVERQEGLKDEYSNH